MKRAMAALEVGDVYVRDDGEQPVLCRVTAVLAFPDRYTTVLATSLEATPRRSEMHYRPGFRTAEVTVVERRTTRWVEAVARTLAPGEHVTVYCDAESGDLYA